MKYGKNFVRYAIAAFAGITAELCTEVIIPGNTVTEKLAGIVVGVLVGTGVNHSLDNESERVYKLDDQKVSDRLNARV